MPRKARKKSSTQIYHVVIRGMDHQTLFEEVKDYIKYLDILAFYKQECVFNLYAYCLMSNHVHIILQTCDIPLDTIFRKINTNYAIWFNMKYQRCGHLQQERFYSEPIEDQAYFLTAIRYIHRNPCKAGLESSPGMSYQWSSIHAYLNSNSDFIDIDFVYKIMSPLDFLDFNNVNSNDTCLDIDQPRKGIPDDVARDIIFSISNCRTSTEFKNLSLLDRRKYLKSAISKGISIRQLNRLTGISLGTIQRTIGRDAP